MKNISFILLLFTFSFYSNLNAQIENDLRNDFFHALNTGGRIACSFTSFDDGTPIKFAGSLAAISAAYAVDYNVKNFAQKNQSDFNSALFSIDKVYGSGYTLIGVGGIYGYGLLFHNKEVRKIGLQTIEAVGYAGLITSVLKAIVGRSRPYTGDDKLHLQPFNTHAAFTSFPSGHATVAFAFSTVLANNTDNLALKILCYTGSGLVAAARIYHNAHWLSDVVAGGAIGYFVGDIVSNTNVNKYTDFSINISPNSIGFSYIF